MISKKIWNPNPNQTLNTWGGGRYAPLVFTNAQIAPGQIGLNHSWKNAWKCSCYFSGCDEYHEPLFFISHILRRVLVPQLCNSLGNFLNKCERKGRVGCAISWTNHGGAFPRKMSNHSSFLHKTSHQKVPLSKSATINDPKDDSYKVLSNKSIFTVVIKYYDQKRQVLDSWI